MQSMIGNITLNISFVLYLTLCIPQTVHNLIHKNTSGLSLLMYLIFCTSWIADLMYGFGNHMQWQYRMVTLTGLFFLSIQFVQLGMYRKITYRYFLLGLYLLSFLIFSITAVSVFAMSRVFYDAMGVVAEVSGFLYMLPQIYKNFKIKSVESLSLFFILIDVISSFCDSITAWTLHWDYPSRFGEPFVFTFGVILLLQFVFYKPKTYLTSSGCLHSSRQQGPQ